MSDPAPPATAREMRHERACKEDGAMIPPYVTPDRIARVAGLTKQHVRRRVALAETEGLAWYGEHLRVVPGPGGPEVETITFPIHIQEAFFMLDQLKLPFPPPRDDA